MEYQTCPDCGRKMHPDYLHIDYRDCQIALAASLGSVNEFAANLEKSLMRRIDECKWTPTNLK